MNEKPKTKWRWRLLRWGLVGLAGLVTLMAIVITEENLRAKHEWENYQRLAEARGEQLDWSAYAANLVPDDQNFAKAPVFAGLYSRQWDEKTSSWKPVSTNSDDPLSMYFGRSDGGPDWGGGDWRKAQLADLKIWQDYYLHPKAGVTGDFPVSPIRQTPPADVLLALSKYDSAIEEWRAASRRPFAQFGITNVSDSREFSRMLNYLAAFKRCAQVLQLRAIAELADNQDAEGLADVELLLSLEDKLGQDPMLITHLVEVAVHAMTVQPIYEGLVQHRWNDAQLAELQRALGARDFLADYQKAMRGERMFAIAMLENQRITREIPVQVDDGHGQAPVNIRMWWLPSAFFYQTELAFVQMHEQFILPLVDLTNRVVSPADERRTETALKNKFQHVWLYKIEDAMPSPALITVVKKFVMAQSSVDLAQVACALERYRLAYGDYPETLDVLEPQYIDKLPHDIINGQPLHYRLTNGRNYILYSVGWNEKDDGGQVILTKKGRDTDKGDWVWNSAAK